MNSGVVGYKMTLSTDDCRIARWIANQIIGQWGEENIWAVGRTNEQWEGETEIMVVIKDTDDISPYNIIEKVRALSAQFSVDVLRGEFIGDVPLRVILRTASQVLKIAEIDATRIVY
ncbi:MAG: hypothetical protein GX318_04155 [Clostridia bacterium]|nr:hypothetical protein [Clostridia bacterium]